MPTRDHAGVLFPPPLMFVLPLVCAIVADQRSHWPIVESRSAFLTGVGVVLVACAACLGVVAVATFRRAGTTILPALRPTTEIVATGPYRFTRNPMYLGMAVAYVGASLALNNAWALAASPVIIAAVDHFVIRREEHYLSRKFGASYAAYKRAVRRWV